MINGSACGSKPGGPSHPVTEGPWLTIVWTCPPSLDSLILHHFPPPPG